MVARKPRVLIIGAGMAGLAAATTLYAAAGDLLELRVVEGGHRIGGRVRSAVYGSTRVELGATWIHGIGGSPLYQIADDIGALSSEIPWEGVDLQPADAVTVAEDGHRLDPSLVRDVSLVFNKMMQFAEGKSVVEYGELSNGRPDFHRLCSEAAIFSGEENLSLGAFLRRGFDAYFHSDDRRLHASAIFAMHENMQRSHTSAEDLSCLDYMAESQYRMYPGDEINIAKGYSAILENLASSLPPGMIQVGRPVSEIRWLPGTEEEQNAGVGNGGPPDRDHDGGCSRPPVRVQFSDGTAIFADHVVVTVSLGVLKAGIYRGGLFNPSLPAFKEGAIARLGFGVVDKLFAEMASPVMESPAMVRGMFDPSPVNDSPARESPARESVGRQPPGRRSQARFPSLNMVFYPSESELRRPEIPWWMRRTFSLSPVHHDSRVLLSWFVGKEALALEGMGEEEIIRGLETTVGSFLRPSGVSLRNSGHCSPAAEVEEYDVRGFRVAGVLKSKWGSDPLFMGSYSFVAVGSSIDDLDAIAEPLPAAGGSGRPLQVLFAGEATHRTHYSTTHGAYLSGLREAGRLIKHYHYLDTCVLQQ